MTWFVASLRDEDTHLAKDVTDGRVTALCGHSFRPLARLNGRPPDPAASCGACAPAVSSEPAQQIETSS
ncbi:MAG: hypothetical protein ACRDT0_06195 [Pseudonocardiaceae bacterium]